MTTTTRPMTAQELLDLPDDGKRRELVRGELREMTPAGSEHGAIALNLGASLNIYVRNNKLGRTYTAETGFKTSTDPDTVRAPDAAFVIRERVEAAGKVAGYFPGAPDLAVEVVSPNDRHSEVVEKALAWLEAGCRMVVVADLERKVVTVYRSRAEIRILAEGETLDGADVVPGWTLPVSEIFE